MRKNVLMVWRFGVGWFEYDERYLRCLPLGGKGGDMVEAERNRNHEVRRQRGHGAERSIVLCSKPLLC